MKISELDWEIPAAKNRDCLMPPESDWRLTSPEMELKLAWYCFYSDANFKLASPVACNPNKHEIVASSDYRNS